MKFEEFNLHHSILEGLDAMGFTTTTPIQEEAIPIILQNHDIIGCAQTGTGKTAAYILPIIQKILEEEERGKNKALIIAPTRELAQQIDQQIAGFGYFANVSSAAIYGGNDSKAWDSQRNALMQGADMVVATPGRLKSHLNFDYVDFSEIKYIILDEADRMLDMGFFDDIMSIFEHVPQKRQTLLFSATMPDKIRELAKTILKNPKSVNIAVSKPAEAILQAAFLVNDKQKINLAMSLLVGDKNLERVLVFASTRSNVKQLVVDLKKAGLNIEGIHSDLTQQEREEVLNNFKSNKLKILAATDIVSRGIDIKGINLIINFDVPKDPEDYIHRVGRTARADATGTALTFINKKDIPLFFRIEELIGDTIYKSPLPLGFEPGPVYEMNKKTSKSSHFAKTKKSFPRKNKETKNNASKKTVSNTPKKTIKKRENI